MITAEEARSVADFMHLTPAEGGWRVAIVDAVDDLNPTSMNALLKILEEPPKRAVLLLIYHGAGRILPTIRSRCRRLVLKPLEAGVLDRLLAAQAPDLPAEERGPLAQLARGSLSRALDLIEAGGLGLYRQVFQLASATQPDAVQMQDLPTSWPARVPRFVPRRRRHACRSAGEAGPRRRRSQAAGRSGSGRGGGVETAGCPAQS